LRRAPSAVDVRSALGFDVPNVRAPSECVVVLMLSSSSESALRRFHPQTSSLRHCCSLGRISTTIDMLKSERLCNHHMLAYKGRLSAKQSSSTPAIPIIMKPICRLVTRPPIYTRLGLFDVCFSVKERWRRSRNSGYAAISMNRTGRSLPFVNILVRMCARALLPKNFMDAQHCSFCDVSQRTNCAFICHFVYAEPFPVVF